MWRPLVLVGLLAGCGLATPPIDTPKVRTVLTLNQLSGGAIPVGSPTPVIVPPIPEFRVQDPAGLPIPVPENARRVNLSSAVLHLALTNRLTVPLALRLMLSRTGTPYADPTANLTPEPIQLAPGATRTIEQPVDPALFKQEVLHLGVVLSTPGSGGVVTVSGSDQLEMDSWVTVRVRVL